MFDYVRQQNDLSFTKALVFCSVGAGIGLGTCGIGFVIDVERVSPVLITIGEILFWGSLLGMLVIDLSSLGRRILNGIRK